MMQLLSLCLMGFFVYQGIVIVFCSLVILGNKLKQSPQSPDAYREP